MTPNAAGEDLWKPSLGATLLDDGRCRFRVWAPGIDQVEVRLLGGEDRFISLTRDAWGYFEAITDQAAAGMRYVYRLNHAIERPDPASKSQPDGVHAASEVVDTQFPWRDHAWRGLPLHEYIFYELHVGTYSSAGTFAGVAEHLDELGELGVTALEIMPVAQCPGSRNWGYDGVYPFVVQNSYGGPRELQKLVDACHHRGLAVVLDVVYNHLGPEGNYLADYAPYFSSRYHIPWGQAINFDGRHSDSVRQFFIENALYWITEFHIDALRLDAVQTIFDQTASPFLAELATAVQQQAAALGRQVYLISESGQNDPRLTRAQTLGGLGLDSDWNEDFQRSLHALLTGERNGFYSDYRGLDHFAKCYSHGYAFDGQYNNYRGRRHGVSSHAEPAEKLVVFNQNHDQTGNRLHGERLCHLVDFETQKLAAGLTLFAPYLPLLFMGEEYAEQAPFLYFISHSDPHLIEGVRQGRKKDFRHFDWEGKSPEVRIPDPQSEETFERSRLNHAFRLEGRHALLWNFYREAIRLRKRTPALATLDKQAMEVHQLDQQALIVHRWTADQQILLAANMVHEPVTIHFHSETAQEWRPILDSAASEWAGPGESGSHEDGSGFVLGLQPRSLLLLSSKGPTQPLQPRLTSGK